MANPPKIKIPGIGSIPSGFMLGRTAKGVGDVQLLTPTQVAHSVAQTGVVSRPGDASASVSGTTNKVAKFTATNVVGNSSITDTGSLISTSVEVHVDNAVKFTADAVTFQSSPTAGLTDASPGYVVTSDDGFFGLAITPITAGEPYLELNGVGVGADPFVVMSLQRGTVASPTALQTGDILGSHGFSSHDGTSFRAGGAFRFKAAENFSVTHVAVDFVVETADSDGTMVERIKAAGNSGVTLQGTRTNDSAASGKIGEYLTGQTSTTSMTSGISVTLASVSLTAGDWDVEGTTQLNPAVTTVISNAKAGVNTTNNTLPGPMTAGGYSAIDATTAAGSGHVMQTGSQRLSLTTTTTVYLVGQATFTISTMTGDGFIRARRVR